MTPKTDSISALKAWIFPSIVSILAMMIWNDVNEIKQDVKALMAQSNIDKTRIDNLERIIYKNRIVGLSIPNPPDKPIAPLRYELVAILPDPHEKRKTNNQFLGHI